MKNLVVFIILLILSNISALYSQQGFNPETYYQRLEKNKDLTYGQLLSEYPLDSYYKDRLNPVDPYKYMYFDSIVMKYGITEDELRLLQRNKFMITERLNKSTMEEALDEIFHYDLPVFVSTDIILNSLHISYDNILMDLELSILEPNLISILNSMQEFLPALRSKYQGNPGLERSLKDLDVYLTVALTLTDSTVRQPLMADQAEVDSLLKAVYSEAVVEMPLFSERTRYLDFSQFKPRGHYSQIIDYYPKPKTLSNYFRTMMWLGRIDFYLTPPPAIPEWSFEEIRRMHLGAYLLEELLITSGAYEELLENENVIRFMVGKSDNLTPWEYYKILQEQIPGSTANELLIDSIYIAYYKAIAEAPESEQKILSEILFADPLNPEPDPLPVSYRLMGQRFIIDSYIFANVVYDRVPGLRLMPDPLDAMFVLGNDNALPLLENELLTYHYAPQLDALRYLVDAYNQDFWQSSLYNTWLQCIRELNPLDKSVDIPYFMSTTAWQHQKLNTQLASWAQLRHDNLLYAKQSYTWGVICSFPHSFVEPYPEFYKRIGEFCDAAYTYFSGMQTVGYRVTTYFNNVREIMQHLSIIAEKELMNQSLNEGEIIFLKGMLRKPELICGAPPYAGWLTDLYYDVEKMGDEDYITADVHTQPTDEWSNMVGKILHVGTGQINLGIFLAGSPSNQYSPVAFIGPFMSYYEKITDDFFRMTDEFWSEQLLKDKLPARPSWTSVYLLDEEGNKLPEGLKIPGILFAGVDPQSINDLESLHFGSYPNPAAGEITFKIPSDSKGTIEISIFDLYGRQVEIIKENLLNGGITEIRWNPFSIQGGTYFAVLKFENTVEVIKLILLK